MCSVASLNTPLPGSTHFHAPRTENSFLGVDVIVDTGDGRGHSGRVFMSGAYSNVTDMKVGVKTRQTSCRQSYF